MKRKLSIVLLSCILVFISAGWIGCYPTEFVSFWWVEDFLRDELDIETERVIGCANIIPSNVFNNLSSPLLGWAHPRSRTDGCLIRTTDGHEKIVIFITMPYTSHYRDNRGNMRRRTGTMQDWVVVAESPFSVGFADFYNEIQQITDDEIRKDLASYTLQRFFLTSHRGSGSRDIHPPEFLPGFARPERELITDFLVYSFSAEILNLRENKYRYSMLIINIQGENLIFISQNPIDTEYPTTIIHPYEMTVPEFIEFLQKNATPQN